MSKQLSNIIRTATGKTKRFTLVVTLYLLKRKADKLSRKTGIQHFIIKWCGSIIIINKQQFRHNRQRGLFPKQFTADNLKKIALYYTK